MKYLYNIAKNKVICVTHYAGKPIRGIAKCDTTHDTFDIDVGKRLAKLRCDLKLAKKKIDRANKRITTAEVELKKVTKFRDKSVVYCNEAMNNYLDIFKELSKLEESLK